MSVTALYARVSSGRQEQERTIESQLTEIERVSGSEKIASEHRYIDDGWSGHTLERPGLDALRDAATIGSIDRVVVYDPDRLARRFVDQQVVIEELDKHGVEVVFVTGGQARTDEERMALQMRGVFAEYERAKILERTRRGRLHRAKQGAPPGWGNPPYGYRYVPRDRHGTRGLVMIEEVEATVVRTIFGWVADEGMRIRTVAERLQQHGRTTRRGGPWMTSTLSKMLRNPVYVGSAHHYKYEAIEPARPRARFGYRRAKKSSSRMRPREQWIEVAVPAIIDVEMFERVQQRLRDNRASTFGQVQHPHLLRGLLRCVACGRTMFARTAIDSAKHMHRYYRCFRDPLNYADARLCDQSSVRAQPIEDVVWNDLTRWIQEPKQLVAQLNASANHAASLAQAHVAEQRHVRRQIGALDSAIARLVDAYQGGALKLDELRARRDRLEEQRVRHERRLQTLQEHGRRSLAQRKIADAAHSLCTSLREGLANCSFADRRAIVELLIERVDVGEDTLDVHYIVPLRPPPPSPTPTRDGTAQTSPASSTAGGAGPPADLSHVGPPGAPEPFCRPCSHGRCRGP